jgi:hypothetical protein
MAAPIKRGKQWMRATIRYAREVIRSRFDRIASSVAAVAFLVIIGRIVFGGQPELFPGAGRLGGVGYELSLAYAASYIFYLLVVAMPSAENRRRLRPMIESAVSRIIGDESAILIELGAPPSSGDEVPNDDDIAGYCAATDPHAPVPRAIMENGQWVQGSVTKWEVIAERFQRTRLAVERLFRAAPFLDAELVQLLDAVESEFLFWMVRDNLQLLLVGSNPDFSAWIPQFVSYHHVIVQLRDYLSREKAAGSTALETEG